MKKIVYLFGCVMLLALFSSCERETHTMFGTLHGVVTDHATGTPLENANVVLSPGGRTIITGADGRFEFGNLEPRQYTITVQRTGFQTNRVTVTAIVGESIQVNVPLTRSN